MIVQIEIELDLISGKYDVRFYNQNSPDEPLNTEKLTKVGIRVLEDVLRDKPTNTPVTQNMFVNSKALLN